MSQGDEFGRRVLDQAARRVEQAIRQKTLGFLQSQAVRALDREILVSMARICLLEGWDKTVGMSPMSDKGAVGYAISIESQTTKLIYDLYRN